MADQDIAQRVAARFAADENRRLILDIYKRFNVSDKMIRSGKHIVHFTGNYAKAYGVGNYTNVTLEDLSPEDLKRAAKAVGVHA